MGSGNGFLETIVMILISFVCLKIIIIIIKHTDGIGVAGIEMIFLFALAHVASDVYGLSAVRFKAVLFGCERKF